jgi:NADH-quinone oxidoreductase subunit A
MAAIDYLPIFLTMLTALAIGIAVVFASNLFGPQRPNKEKISVYESGMQPVGTVKERVSVKYYLVAMLFIIFDIEVIFVYPWAVKFKSLYSEYGIYAFVPMFIFLVIFELGFLYAYKKGAFKWD